MLEPELKLNEKGHGSFLLADGDKKLAEMVIAVVDNDLIVYHTEVSPELTGQGFAKLLLDTMVAYARKNALKVTPLCRYVQLQFKRHPKEFEDIWNVE
jgi:predicted GNAT family acetyltransferase